MIRRMFNFSETTVYKVMVPLIDVNAVEKRCTVGEAVRLAVESSHVRLPVYDGRIDRVIGVLNTMDLLGVDQSLSIEGFHQPDALRSSQQERRVDARRTAQGWRRDGRGDGRVRRCRGDHHHRGHHRRGGRGHAGRVRPAGKAGRVAEEARPPRLPGQCPCRSDDADREAGAEAAGDGSYETLSGFLLEYAREIPKPGTMIEVEGIKFTIQRATPQVIQEVQIRW
jgi:hypothetical protein